MLDEGKTKMIETVACIDRTFQQRRLLEGNSTENINVKQAVLDIDTRLKAIDDLIKELDDEERGEIHE